MIVLAAVRTLEAFMQEYHLCTIMTESDPRFLPGLVVACVSLAYSVWLRVLFTG